MQKAKRRKISEKAVFPPCANSDLRYNRISFRVDEVCLVIRAPVAQLDSASVFGTEGWGFESLQACFLGFSSVLGETFFCWLTLDFTRFNETGDLFRAVGKRAGTPRFPFFSRRAPDFASSLEIFKNGRRRKFAARLDLRFEKRSSNSCRSPGKDGLGRVLSRLKSPPPNAIFPAVYEVSAPRKIFVESRGNFIAALLQSR